MLNMTSTLLAELSSWDSPLHPVPPGAVKDIASAEIEAFLRHLASKRVASTVNILLATAVSLPNDLLQ